MYSVYHSEEILRFFLPLRFHMKSHLEILEDQKLLFLAIKKLWNLFLKSFCLVKMTKFLRNQNQETLNLPKMTVYEFLNSLKLFSRKI